MPKLAFRPDADAFAFTNSFNLDTSERMALDGLAGAAAGGVAAVVPVLGPFLAPLASAFAAGYVAVGPLPTYGLCGGMCYAATDYWTGRVPPPQGANSTDEPVRASAFGAPVRELLWNRLMDSLVAGGVLAKTVEWMLRLNLLPEILGGTHWLRNETATQLERLRGHIDQGEVWPVGLVGTTLSAWDQHQVLVYGYEDSGAKTTLFVYDPNSPHFEGDVNENVLSVHLESRVSALINGPTLQASIGTVVGLFCSDYVPAAPPLLAPSYGMFINEPTAITVQRVAGARLQLSGIGEVSMLGGSPVAVRADTPSPATTGKGWPRDGALLRDRTSTTTMVFAGGAQFPIPPAQLPAFGGAAAETIVAASGLVGFSGPPRDGTLLREVTDPKVYRIHSGVKRWVTTPLELRRWGGFPSVRLVPDGALAAFPTGEPMPTPNPNECGEITTALASLTAEDVRLTNKIAEADEPDNPRAAAELRAARTRVRFQLAALRDRQTVLGCP